MAMKLSKNNVNFGRTNYAITVKLCLYGSTKFSEHFLVNLKNTSDLPLGFAWSHPKSQDKERDFMVHLTRLTSIISE